MSATMPNIERVRSATMLIMSKSKVPVGLKRFAADLMDKNSGVFEELVASVRHYTIGFASIPDSPTDHPGPCGTATLVVVDSAHYFLTAEHVWRKLQKFKRSSFARRGGIVSFPPPYRWVSGVVKYSDSMRCGYATKCDQQAAFAARQESLVC